MTDRENETRARLAQSRRRTLATEMLATDLDHDYGPVDRVLTEMEEEGMKVFDLNDRVTPWARHAAITRLAMRGER